MSESRWITLSPDQIAPSTHPQDALWATESPSPYDVPSHVRSHYDSHTGFINIEFRYIESEPQVELKLDNYATAHVGKRSGRIWSLNFDIHTFNRDKKHIADAAMRSIESLPEAPNRAIAAKAIFSKSSSLFDSATLAIAF